MITAEQIREIMPYCLTAVAQVKAPAISEAMVAFGIDQNAKRQAAYIAQVAQETGELKYTHELASGVQYEGWASLGNIETGDGPKFKGRGDLEVTGRNNYAACSLALYGDTRLLDMPELIEQPRDGSQAGAWFWQAHGLNVLADADHFESITRIINGGLTAQEQRILYWDRAKRVYGIA